MTILLVGSGAREHAIARAIARSPQHPELVCFGSSSNPGIRKLSRAYTAGTITDTAALVAFGAEHHAELAVIGPEGPLEAGAADALFESGIPCIGPKQALARIETSKSFARELLSTYGISGNPHYRIFLSANGVDEYLTVLGDSYVVKADGLMSGKGVKVSGDHLASHSDALAYARELSEKGMAFLIEEKLEGEEFSLMSFSDGYTLAHMPPVQDHKRASCGDLGPNTGGMGSYSDANHLLPFLSLDDVVAARAMNEKVIQALSHYVGERYVGILYGGFMATRFGVKLVEYNARFGDPEAMNVLSVLDSDIVALFQAMTRGKLSEHLVRFREKATVCKYAVPEGYPDAPVKNQPIDVSRVENADQLYFASVHEQAGALIETGSRAVAAVGIADTIAEAEKIAEKELGNVRGPLVHRNDIGTAELIQKRVDHMHALGW